jgi:hypothetical protein
MYRELEDCMQEVRLHAQLDEARVLSKVKKILDRHLGEPPKTFVYEGKTYTPRSFVAEVVRLPWNEYQMLTSFESAPFNDLGSRLGRIRQGAGTATRRRRGQGGRQDACRANWKVVFAEHEQRVAGGNTDVVT